MVQLKELAQHLIIDPRKLTQYALNWEHPMGQHKAYLFERLLGYNLNNYEELLTQIHQLAPDADVIVRSEDSHGQHVQVDLMITGIQWQQVRVRTGWLIPLSKNEARLVSIYVKV